MPRTWVLALTSAASLMVALDLLVVSTALTSIRVDLDAPVDQLQWTVTAYGLAFAVLLMPGAALGDRIGRRRMFTVGLGVFAAASAACALAPDLGWLVVARTVQGAGAALVMPLAVTLLSAAYPAERRGRALGILEGVTGLATIGGPPLGGVLAQTVGWEWIFWVNVPIAAVVIPLALRYIAKSHGPDTALDLPGMLLVAGAALGVVWGLVRGGEAGWTSPEVLGALAAGAVLTLAFVRWERRTREPLLPMALFRSRAFGAATVTSALLFGGLYGSVFFLAQVLQTGLGYSAAGAGLALIPWTVCLLLVAPVAGSVADRVGNRPVLVGGLALMATGLGWVALVAEPGMDYLALAVPLVVAGVGTSMAVPVVQNAVLGAVDPAVVGKASGVNTMAQELGGALGVAALVAVFTVAGGYDSPDRFLDGALLAVGGCAAFALAGALVALAVPGRQGAEATR